MIGGHPVRVTEVVLPSPSGPPPAHAHCSVLYGSGLSAHSPEGEGRRGCGGEGGEGKEGERREQKGGEERKGKRRERERERGNIKR